MTHCFRSAKLVVIIFNIDIDFALMTLFTWNKVCQKGKVTMESRQDILHLRATKKFQLVSPVQTLHELWLYIKSLTSHEH